MKNELDYLASKSSMTLEDIRHPTEMTKEQVRAFVDILNGPSVFTGGIREVEMSIEWEWSKWEYIGSYKSKEAWGFSISCYPDDVYYQVFSVAFWRREWVWRKEKIYFDVEPQTEEEKDPAFYKGIEILERMEEKNDDDK